MHVLKSLGRQGIDVGSVGMWVAVTADPIDVVVFTRQPQDVGTLIGERGSADEDGDEQTEIAEKAMTHGKTAGGDGGRGNEQDHHFNGPQG